MSLGVLQVGDDEFGYMLADVLKDEKVETKGIRFDSHARTALAFVTLRADGEREFMFYRNPSADMLFEIPELDTALLKQVLLTYMILTDCGRCKFCSIYCFSGLFTGMQFMRNTTMIKILSNIDFRLPSFTMVPLA